MKRKIIRQGNNSYTMTLPVRWVRENSLDEGDEISIEHDAQNLLIKPQAGAKRQELATSFDISGYDESTIKNVISQAYRKGFDSISIRFSKKEQLEFIRGKVHDLMLGFEVIEEGKDQCLIHNIAEPSSEKFDVIVRKMFLIIKQLSEETLSCIENNKGYDLKRIEQIKTNFDNFANFVRRVTIRDRVMGSRDSYFLFNSLYLLSFIFHGYYFIYSFLSVQKKRKLSKDTISMLKKANQLFEDYYNSFYKRDLAIAHNIGVSKKRIVHTEIYSLLQKKTGIDNVILYHIGEIVSHIQMATIVIFAMAGEEKKKEQ